MQLFFPLEKAMAGCLVNNQDIVLPFLAGFELGTDQGLYQIAAGFPDRQPEQVSEARRYSPARIQGGSESHDLHKDD